MYQRPYLNLVRLFGQVIAVATTIPYSHCSSLPFAPSKRSGAPAHPTRTPEQPAHDVTHTVLGSFSICCCSEVRAGFLPIPALLPTSQSQPALVSLDSFDSRAPAAAAAADIGFDGARCSTRGSLLLSHGSDGRETGWFVMMVSSSSGIEMGATDGRPDRDRFGPGPVSVKDAFVLGAVNRNNRIYSSQLNIMETKVLVMFGGYPDSHGW